MTHIVIPQRKLFATLGAVLQSGHKGKKWMAHASLSAVLTNPEVDDAAVEQGLHQLEGDAHNQQRQRPGAGRVESVVPLLEQHPAAGSEI